MALFSIPDIGFQTQVPHGADPERLERIADNLMLSNNSNPLVTNIASFLMSEFSQPKVEIEKPSINPAVAAGLGAENTLRYLQMQQDRNVSEAELKQRERIRIAQEQEAEKDRAAAFKLEKMKIDNAKLKAELDAQQAELRQVGNDLISVKPGAEGGYETETIYEGQDPQESWQRFEAGDGFVYTFNPKTQEVKPLIDQSGNRVKARPDNTGTNRIQVIPYNGVPHALEGGELTPLITPEQFTASLQTDYLNSKEYRDAKRREAENLVTMDVNQRLSQLVESGKEPFLFDETDKLKFYRDKFEAEGRAKYITPLEATFATPIKPTFTTTTGEGEGEGEKTKEEETDNNGDGKSKKKPIRLDLGNL